MTKIIGFAGGAFLNVDLSAAPILLGQIPDASVFRNTGTHQYDLSSYFAGATSYAISPAIEAGWSFDTGTGLLTIDTDALGAFGPFTVTATNANGSTPSNGFSITVAEAVTATLGNMGPQFFQPMSATIGYVKPKKPKKKREPEPESVITHEEPAPVEIVAPPAPKRAEPAPLPYRELREGLSAARAELVEAHRRRLAQEEEEAAALLLLLMA